MLVCRHEADIRDASFAKYHEDALEEFIHVFIVEEFGEIREIVQPSVSQMDLVQEIVTEIELLHHLDKALLLYEFVVLLGRANPGEILPDVELTDTVQ